MKYEPGEIAKRLKVPETFERETTFRGHSLSDLTRHDLVAVLYWALTNPPLASPNKRIPREV